MNFHEIPPAKIIIRWRGKNTVSLSWVGVHYTSIAFYGRLVYYLNRNLTAAAFQDLENNTENMFDERLSVC